MPMILSSPFKSFNVDSLSKRWAAILLILFVWGVSFWFQVAPPGDPDFSQMLYWYQDFAKAKDPYLFMDQHPFSTVFTASNALYLFSAMFYGFFLFLCGQFYFVMYVCDLRKVPLSRAPSIFFTRVWWMILFSVVFFVPVLFLVSILSYFVLLWIPAFYAMPGLVFFEKKDSFTASIKSFSKTRGHKFSILIEITIISLLFFILSAIVQKILNAGSLGLGLVQSFLISYFTLVMARNMGKRYHLITILPNLY